MYPLSSETYTNARLMNHTDPKVSKQAVYDKITQRLESGMSVKQSINAMAAYSGFSAKKLLKVYNEYKNNKLRVY